MFKIFFTLSLFAAFVGLSHPLDGVIDLHAARKNPILAKAFEDDRAEKMQSLEDMTKILKGIQTNANGQDAADMEQRLKLRVQAEKVALDTFLATAMPHKAHMTWSLRTQKMGWHLEALLGDETPMTAANISKLFQGEFYNDLKVEDDSLPAVLEKENPANYWGTVNGTQTELLLTLVLSELTGVKNALETLTSAGVEIDETPIAHVVPVAEEIVEALPPTDSFFLGQYKNEPSFLQFHTGFLFGGHKGEHWYPEGKTFGPHDCSSYADTRNGYHGVSATLYHQYFWLSELDPDSYAEKMKAMNAEQTTDIQAQIKKLSEVYMAVPVDQVQLGDVIGWRNKKGGGHVGLYTGSTEDDAEFAIMGTNRGLTEDKRDGKGLELIRCNPLDAEYYAFRAKA